MLSRSIPLAVLLALAAGCGKSKPSDPGTPGGDPGAPGEPPADPNATYTLTFREPAKGETYDVVRARTGTATVTTPNLKKTDTQKEDFRFEYAETIVETEAGEPRPTKVTRAYKTAQKANPKGEMEKRSHVGKTITIEKYLKGYKFSVGKESLPVAEQVEVNQDFVTSQWKLDQFLPKKPVKVGEEWPVDFASIAAIGGSPQTKYDKDKSKFTGKLVRVYKKDGRQWGVIEQKIKLVIDTTAPNGSPIKGEVNTDGTLDVVIDGSARAGTIKMTLSGKIDDRDATGLERQTTIEGTEERSLTPVK